MMKIRVNGLLLKASLISIVLLAATSPVWAESDSDPPVPVPNGYEALKDLNDDAEVHSDASYSGEHPAVPRIQSDGGQPQLLTSSLGDLSQQCTGTFYEARAKADMQGNEVTQGTSADVGISCSEPIETAYLAVAFSNHGVPFISGHPIGDSVITGKGDDEGQDGNLSLSASTSGRYPGVDVNKRDYHGIGSDMTWRVELHAFSETWDMSVCLSATAIFGVTEPEWRTTSCVFDDLAAL